MSKSLAFLLYVCCSAYLTTAMMLKNTTATDNCDCVSWKDAFNEHNGANCWNMHDPYVCSTFLMKLPNENFCMNAMFGNTQQWCYVASDCKMGQNLTWVDDDVTSNLLWKECDSELPSLKDKKIVDLFAWCKQNNLDIGVAAQFAYPLADEKLFEVMPYWELELPKDAPANLTVAKKNELSEELSEQLQQQEESGQTMFYRSQTQHSPFGVSEGKKFYWLNLGDAFINLLVTGRANETWKHAGVVTTAACVAGCENNTKPWWSVLNNLGDEGEDDA